MSRLFAFAGICSLAALLVVTATSPPFVGVDMLAYSAPAHDVVAENLNATALHDVAIVEKRSTERTRMPPVIAYQIQKALQVTSQIPPAYRHIDPGRRGA